MEAIAALFGAIIEGLLMVFVGLVEVAASLMGLVLEFLFVAVTEGISAASQRFGERREQQRQQKEAESADETTTSAPVSAESQRFDDRRERLQQQKETPSTDGSAASAPSSETPTADRRVVLWVSALTVTVVICTGVGFYLHERAQERRRESTRKDLAVVANQLAEDLKDENTDDPEAGMLDLRDAWGRRCELFVDRHLLGTLLVVRSSGEDGETGTMDDLLAVRTVRARAKDVGRELAHRGADAIRDRLKKLLPGNKDELPEDVDMNADP